MLPALFAFSTRPRVVTSGVAFVNSMSSSFSSDSDSSRNSPSLASDEILYFRLNEFSEA